MIQRVTLRNFKRFEEQVFDLADSVVLAGPNNAGKSTLLQAIATWKFGLDRWVARRQDGSSAVKRTGVAITRNDFTTVPLREMNLLWKDRRVSGGDGPGASRFIEIEVAGYRDGVTWECGLEFQYHSREMVYVRPLGAKRLGGDDISRFPPKAAVGIEVVHVPPLSGIQRDEPLHARGMQDLLVGQGRSGELLRNLLLGIHQSGNEDWHSLASRSRPRSVSDRSAEAGLRPWPAFHRVRVHRGRPEASFGYRQCRERSPPDRSSPGLSLRPPGNRDAA